MEIENEILLHWLNDILALKTYDCVPYNIVKFELVPFSSQDTICIYIHTSLCLCVCVVS